MNSTIGFGGGIDSWESSYMRNTICPEFLEAMPTEWQDIIKPTIKYTNYESNIVPTEDKIFLLAENECGLSYCSNTIEKDYTVPYSIYYETDADRIRYMQSSLNTAYYWWERSPNARFYGYDFGAVAPDGDSYVTYANYSLGFAPAFTIF